MHAADGRSWRAQGLVPSGARVTAAAACVCVAFEQPAPPADSAEPGWRSPFRRREWLVDADRVLDLCRALLAADPVVDRSNSTTGRSTSTRWSWTCWCAPTEPATRAVAAPGPPMHQELAGRLETTAGSSGVRLSRCSHTGGHRFAPTALTLPDGYALGPPDRRAHRTTGQARGDAGRLRPALSGIVAVRRRARPRPRTAPRWWSSDGTGSDATRRAVVVAHERDTRATTVRIDGRLGGIGSSAADRVAIEVRVEIERFVPQPTCGVVDGSGVRGEPVWRDDVDVRRASSPAQ